MAQFEKWFTQDLTKDVPDRHCESVTFTGDNLANVIGVNLFVNGEPYSGGGTVAGTVIRADGITVPVNGTLDGNSASITLTDHCLAVPGIITVNMKLIDTTERATILHASFTAVLTETGTAVDPEEIIPDLATLQAAADEATAAAADARAAASSAVRYDTAQSLTDAQKAQARENVGAASLIPTGTAFSQAVQGGTTYDVQDSAARAGVLAALDAQAAINFGWVAGEQTATVASVAVTRNGNRVTLNGTASSYAYIRMCGSLVGVAGGEATAAQNISGFTTISGHLYLFKLRLLSGSISYSGTSSYSIGPSHRWASTTTGPDDSYTLPEIDSEGWIFRWFTGNGNGVATWLYFVTGVEFTNAEFELTAIDATADNQINRTAGDVDARLSGGYPISWYGVPAFKKYGNLSVSYFDGVARLSGTYWTNNASTMWSVSNGIQTYGGQANTSFVNPNAILKAGHTYRVSAIILSGTVTGTSTSKPAMRYYTRVGTGSVVTTEFTTDLISTTTSATYPIVCDKYMTPASDTQIGFGFWTRSPSQATAETYNDLTVVFRVEDISLTGTATQNIAAADTLTATSSHASGSLLTVGGRLYKATSAIAAGETIVSGSGGNVTATSIAAELAALEARIAALEG